MKDGRPGVRASEAPKPRPNLKNKNFVKWSKAEPFKQEDNIISTEWHERLQKITPFTPVYDNAPTNMVYLMSGEYGRMWQKERDEWFSTVFVLNKKENDMENRKRKIRQQAREAKKAAEKNIQARKERRETEKKIKAQKAEKLKKEKEEKETTAKKRPSKKKEKSIEVPTPAPEKSEAPCSKGWRQVELTVQCECSNHARQESEKQQKAEKEEGEARDNPPMQEQQQEQRSGEKQEEPHLCEDYIKQLRQIQEKKEKEKSTANAQET